jgi:acetoin utilization deacetylase AcuC-like enzyme
LPAFDLLDSAPVQVVYSAAHQGHDPATEVDFGQVLAMFERPERVEEIRRALSDRPDRFGFVAPTEHGLGPIEAVHDPGLVAFLAEAWASVQVEEARREVLPDTFIHAAIREGMGPAPQPAGVGARLGYWCFETMTPLVEGTYAAARGAVDVALTAADLVSAGERAAYGLCRPPGHHAPRAAYGGYCYFNNAAVVAQDLAVRHGSKVSVLDVDYHHGNGTQQIFYGRPDVQYASLHGDPNRAYPYFAGYADETGTGPGSGSTMNLPLGAGTGDDDYLVALAAALEAIDRFAPDLLVVSLGVDTYHLDPIADFALTTEGFGHCGALVAGLGRPTVVLQEGGYHLGAIGENVRSWLLGFDDAA